MRIVCLDLEGVLIPEIWIEFSKATHIPEFSRTTRDESNYDKLMKFRIDLLKKNNLKLNDIQKVISGMEPLDGALDFTNTVREKTQLILLSDTFEQFAKPLMKKLLWPTLLCNTLVLDSGNYICGYKLRQRNGKKEAVKALKTMNMEVFAAGDSFNDLDMIREADAGCLFRAPEKIKNDCSDIPCVDTFGALLAKIGKFLESGLS
jgi:phosphoserine/homoserine phosphotransferase